MAASEKQKKWQKEYRARQKAKNPAKTKQRSKVRNEVNNAVRDGRRKAPPSKAAACPHCGRKGFRKELHHSKGYGTSEGEWRCSQCNPREGWKR